MFNKKAGEEGLSFGTIVIVILVVVAVGAMIAFVYNVTHSGKASLQEQVKSFGKNMTESGECLLWASGIIDSFNCEKTPCVYKTLCDACRHYGMVYELKTSSYKWYVDTFDCVLVNGTKFRELKGCESCKLVAYHGD